MPLERDDVQGNAMLIGSAWSAEVAVLIMVSAMTGNIPRDAGAD